MINTRAVVCSGDINQRRVTIRVGELDDARLFERRALSAARRPMARLQTADRSGRASRFSVREFHREADLDS